MKITLVSGAIKNAGDYLITNRCIALIKNIYPNAYIFKVIGNYSLEEKIDQINATDAVIIAGGPSYTKNIYPGDYPLVKDLSAIKPKIFMLGCGWYGNTTLDKEIYNYRFNTTSCSFMQRVVSDSGVLGCRDSYAIRVLMRNGFKEGYLTGCPALYDLSFLGKRLSSTKVINSIMISDSADARTFGKQSIEIVRYCKKKYPNARIEYIFHRGYLADQFTNKLLASYIQKIVTELDKMEIKYHDISFNDAGFALYDNCDLHIGHRVHAHIYNLSKRKKSILIEEDSRGAGINELLGLWSIKAYSRKINSNASFLVNKFNNVFDFNKPNKYVIQNIDTYLNYIESSKGDIFNVSASLIDYYYERMNNHIISFQTLI